MRCGFDHTPDRFDAGPMPMQARKLPPRGPASVAVHDDADVKSGGVRLDIQFRRESALHYKVSLQKKEIRWGGLQIWKPACPVFRRPWRRRGPGLPGWRGNRES